MKGWKKIFHANRDLKKAGVAILISDKIDFEIKAVKRDKVGSRVVAAVSRFPSRGSRDLWLSLEAFPRGFPTGLSHVPLWCESILGLKVEAVQGIQVSLEWTETSRGLLEWWYDPGVPLAFPVESASS